MGSIISNGIDVTSIISVIVAILSIAAAWWALQAVRFEVLVRTPGSGQAKLLHLLLAIIIGHQISRFVIDYLSWSMNIK